eukprot:6486388-Amphidinium_carterae.1
MGRAMPALATATIAETVGCVGGFLSTVWHRQCECGEKELPQVLSYIGEQKSRKHSRTAIKQFSEQQSTQ